MLFRSRMAHFSSLIAANLGMPAEDQALILQAAPMHDIGKIAIPDHILLKPASLSPEEFAVMKNHVMLGFELLKGSGSKILKSAASIAICHHEKYDGSGYPYGLVGDAIAYLGRIVAVADVFDALTSERPYKKAWSIERAAEYVRDGAGGHFDPERVAAFLLSWEDVLSIHAQYQDEVCPPY